MENELCNDCIDEACDALGRWFMSQEIGSDDAVVIMAATIAKIIRLRVEDPKEIKKGKSLVAKMIRDF